MRIVLLSGGSGKRLWPLSNDARSKQFLKVLKNGQGDMESMVQRVWRQLKKVNLTSDAIISTSQSQVEMLRTQLGADIPVVVEPERKDTFPAIALAAVYLYSMENCSLDEVIGVLPVDPFVEDHFFEAIKELEEGLHKNGADLALLGVTPTYPSEKYGYILPGNRLAGDFMKVSKFCEKPNEIAARKLILQHALWNCGVFSFRLGYVIQLLKEKNIPVQYDDLLEYYNQLPSNSFDYEVVEREKNSIVIPYAGYWKDLGTWSTLTDEMKTPVIGDGVISNDVMKSCIVNELDIPIILIGVEDIVVAASPDGVLVTDKKSSHKIKEYVSHFQEGPMYEEYWWGWSRVLEYSKGEKGEETLVEKIHLTEGGNINRMGRGNKEVWTVTEGEGTLIWNDEFSEVCTGTTVTIPAGETYFWKARSRMELIIIHTGEELMTKRQNRKSGLSLSEPVYSKYS
ncbi:mannose-1-phosphate guanylyltransferase [Rossellomorea vietnamensis]|uniref:sugar phosphate nucleotidyltransferase n=1 Tax=Rossellomorea vietnamensis TaxID=218284 RepID=UPI001CCA739C|nr:sugar phosphate nucleotidyltransferase [Rossellomorea vietnamensis]MCA0149777.1 mannose-1-phosphate guanylyltransferase [Rossellomorea vietnamensis]